MVQTTVVIKSVVGLHARPAASLVREATRHQCSIKLEYEGKEGNAKSIMQVLALGAKSGKEITVYADGPGEEEALRKIVEIIETMDK